MSVDPLDLAELVEHWTLLDGDRELVAGKRGATRLAFALMLKFYNRHGRFPDGDGDLPADVVLFVAKQVDVSAAELRGYDWSERTGRYHRAQIRQHFGYRECTVDDAEVLQRWLVAHVSERDPRLEVVRDELLGRCPQWRIEPPSEGRTERIVRAAVHAVQSALFERTVARLAEETLARIEALVAIDDDTAGEDGASVLALIKSAPGSVSLDSMLVEIEKLEAVRAIGLPPGLFADVTPRVFAGWRQRAAVESPSHLRTHPRALRVTLLAALLCAREREITDTLVDLLISTVHKIGAKAERKVTEELVGEYRRVAGKEELLFRLAEASVQRPEGTVKEVIFPVAGEGTLRDLVAEYKSSGPTYRRTVQTKLRASYTKHYRRGLIRLLSILEFHSNNSAHRPVLDALELIGRYARASKLTYYPAGEIIPAHSGIDSDWRELAYRSDGRARERVVRMVYEIATFQALRDQLRCKEIWVVGADRWCIPDEDLSADFEHRRGEHYAALRKPRDPSEFIDQVRGEMRTELAALHRARCPNCCSWGSPTVASAARSS